MPGPRHGAPRYRRRILTLGLIAALVLFSVGFPIFNNRIEDDLERRVPEELAAAGFTGISASFSGQDGTLRCERPLADPEAATEAAYDVWGVRSITLDRLCRVNRAPTVSAGDDTAETGAESATTADDTSAATTLGGGSTYASIADAVVNEPDLGFLAVLLDEAGSTAMLGDPAGDPVTLFAPTDDAFDALPADVTAQLRSDPDLLRAVLGHHLTEGAVRASDLRPGALTMLDGAEATVTIEGVTITVDGATVVRPDVTAGNGLVHVVDTVLLPPGFEIPEPAAPIAPVTVDLAGGVLTLSGVVASEVERATIVDAATTAAGDGNVVDQLTVDPDTGIPAEVAADVAVLLVPMPGNLVSGTAGFDGTALYLRGVEVSAEAGAAVTAIADALGVVAELEPRPDATAEEAAQLEQQLNDFVAANPVRFEPSSAVLTADAAAVLDQLAALALQFAGVAITVEGHTDSDGDAAANLTLSQERADAVVQGLVERGLDATTLTAEGFGAQQPVLVGGVEDKDASRRVEFRIQTTA